MHKLYTIMVNIAIIIIYHFHKQDYSIVTHTLWSVVLLWLIGEISTLLITQLVVDYD